MAEGKVITYDMPRALSFRQVGIGLPAAIFIITVMALIAAAVNQLVSQNAQTYAEEVGLTRAFFAAESGAGFAMNTIFPPEDYAGGYVNNTQLQKCPANPTIYNLVVPGLNQCTASVSCTLVENGSSNYATIESTGTCGDVERTVQVRTVFDD
ncbi:MAG: MSHA biogenesis protein MshP [Pseudohongiellaceae bacterium]|jgi:MSHA biogenesis protein MshP